MIKITTIRKHSPLYVLPTREVPHPSNFTLASGILRGNL